MQTCRCDEIAYLATHTHPLHNPRPEKNTDNIHMPTTMQEDGYVYLEPSDMPSDWPSLVDAAAEAVDASLERDRHKTVIERINSERMQRRFPRDALPAAVRRVVELLHAKLAVCDVDMESFSLQDCYALYTPSDEVNEEARAPQRWHLDAIKRFPVGALLLRGGRATEFAAGKYSDFSAGVSARELESWTAPLKHINARTWDAESEEEWLHFQQHCHAAGLVTGQDAESGDPECDWSKLSVAPTPDAPSAGSSCLFMSNKVHRGPGTDPGEERLVLFCSWLPAGDKAATKSKESETDYSFYDSHIEPKLRLSERAVRSNKRRRR